MQLKDPRQAHSLLAAALLLPLVPGAARAETAPQETTVSYKYLDYQDSQPGADRVGVKAHALAVTAPLGESWSFDANAVTDAVSGASPRYHTQRLTPLEDRRNAFGLAVTRYLPRGSLTVGGNHSKESDYLSRSLSASFTWFTDEGKNTALLAGLGATRDEINPSNGIVQGERKAIDEVMAGVTQVLTPTDIAQVIVRHSRGRATTATRTRPGTSARAGATPARCCCAGTTTWKPPMPACDRATATTPTASACAPTRWAWSSSSPWARNGR